MLCQGTANAQSNYNNKQNEKVRRANFHFQSQRGEKPLSRSMMGSTVKWRYFRVTTKIGKVIKTTCKMGINGPALLTILTSKQRSDNNNSTANHNLRRSNMIMNNRELMTTNLANTGQKHKQHQLKRYVIKINHTI